MDILLLLYLFSLLHYVLSTSYELPEYGLFGDMMISFLQLKELYGEERAIKIASHINISIITSPGRNLINTNIRLWRDIRADSTSWKVPFGFDNGAESIFN